MDQTAKALLVAGCCLLLGGVVSVRAEDPNPDEGGGTSWTVYADCAAGFADAHQAQP